MALIRQQQRIGTTAQWTATNPILDPGEWGVEITTTGAVKVKIGNGTINSTTGLPDPASGQAWNALAYFAGAGGGSSDTLPEWASGLPASTFLGNPNPTTGEGENVGEAADATPITIETMRSMLGAITADDLTEAENAAKAREGTLSAAEITAGGLRALLDAHVNKVTGAGSGGTFADFAHGLWLNTILAYNGLNGRIDLPRFAAPSGTQAAGKLGFGFFGADDATATLQYKQPGTSVWNILTPSEFTPQYWKMVMPVAGNAHHTWTNQPSASTEVLGESDTAPSTARHRFTLRQRELPYTQFRVEIETLLVAGSANSRLWVQYWDGSAWVDLAADAVGGNTAGRNYVNLTGNLNEPKASGWADILADALLSINLGAALRCRLMGNSSNGTGSPQWGNTLIGVR